MAAIRVFPRAWLEGLLNAEKTAVSEERAGLRAEVPPGGLKRRLLKQVKVGAHVDFYGEFFRRLPVGAVLRGLSAEARRTTSIFSPDVRAALLGVSHLAPLAEHPWGARPKAPVGGRRPGRRPLGDDVLVLAARAYVDAYRRSRRPVPDAAKVLKMSEARMRDLVYRSRRRGFLTPTEHGRGGGDLTPPARALLRKLSKRRTSHRRAR